MRPYSVLCQCDVFRPYLARMAREPNDCQPAAITNNKQEQLQPPAPEPYAFEVIDLDDPSLLECGEPQPQQQLTKPQECRFGAPKNEEIALARKEFVPKRTRQDTAYCIRLWNTWSKYRHDTTKAHIPPLIEMDPHLLQH